MRGNHARDPHALRAVLKILCPEDLAEPAGEPASPRLSAQSTLWEVYRLGFVPLWAEPRKLNALTLEEYERSLLLWQRFAPEQPPASDEVDASPRLWQLEGTAGDAVAGRFMTRLAELPGNKRGSLMAVGTQRKHARNLNKILAFAGPRSRDPKDRKNLGLIADPTVIEAPAADDHPPEGDWTFEEVRQLWTACQRMESGKLRALGIQPVRWWRAIVTVAAHTGLRRGQLLGLCWDDFCPPFIVVRPARSKRRRGRRQYLSDEAVAAIELIRSTHESIFPWPYVVGEQQRMNVRYLDAQLRKLAERAGLPRSRWFGWNGFRKLVACGAFAVAGEEGTQAVLGHAGGSRTAMKHYVSQTAQEQKAAEVINKMPRVRPRDDSRQKRLFE